MSNMKVVKFVTYMEAGDLPESSLGGLGGFFSHGMRWKDYLAQYVPEVHETLEWLRVAILENEIRCDGYEHQNTTASCPVFEDGTCACYSYRAWGDLMAAIWSTAENHDYSYMSFYMFRT